MADKYEKIKVRTESGLLVTKFKDKRTGKIYNQRPVFDPTKSKVSSRLNLGISEELKALQSAERLRLSELPPRSLPTNFTGGALPNRQSLQSLPSAQDLIDVQRESDLAQAFNMAKSNTGEVQFPNLRPVEMQTPITAITDKTLAPKIKAKDSEPSRRQFEPTNREQLKSDVFTLDKDGKPLGVMTRAQRRKWDAANQDLMRKRKNDLLIANRNYGSGGIGTGSG